MDGDDAERGVAATACASVGIAEIEGAQIDPGAENAAEGSDTGGAIGIGAVVGGAVGSAALGDCGGSAGVVDADGKGKGASGAFSCAVSADVDAWCGMEDECNNS